MLKALLHKQMLEIRRMYFYNKKTGSVVTKKSSSTGLTILFIFTYLIIAGSFFAISFLIGEPLVKAGLTWIFFMIMSGLALIAGIFGSVLSTSSALFRAKDNEFLLAMPIPPSKILLARMASVYVMGVIYESMILLPAILFYFITGTPSVFSVIFCILGIFVLGFLILAFSCFFGWLVALIASKLKNKSVLTVIVSLLFIAIFMYLRLQMNTLLRELALHAQEIGESIKGWGYPIYALGLGMSGDAVGFLVFIAITAALFALACLIMSKSFRKIVSAKNEASKAAFSGKQIQTRSTQAALRKKEFKRFTSSPAYMLNCGLGVLLLVAGAVFLLIKMNDIRSFLDDFAEQAPMFVRFFPVLGAFTVCLLTPLCDIAAPSISLEGKNVWILQTLPLDPYAIFQAKLFVHIAITTIPALLCALALIVVLQPAVLTAICMLLCVAAFVFFSASAMLALDLKRPMMDWTNEAQPIKQSLNILISWFGGLLLAAALGALYLLVGLFAGAEVYLLLCVALLSAFTLLLHKWLRGKGRSIFAYL